MSITFYTTSTLSDIQKIQSDCIKKFFPESKHVVINGTSDWFNVWYRWIDIADNIESDWHIHIDEDCFLTSREEILNLIEEMKLHDYDIAGPPDGGYKYRSANHMALNSFFMVLNNRAIDAWQNRKYVPQFKKSWIKEYPFKKGNDSHFEYNMEFGSSGKPLGEIWKPGTEPYYDFMWVLMDNDIKFKYLEPIFDPEFQTTNLLNGSIFHMWYQRDRNSEQIVSTAHTMSNKDRYDGMLNKISKIIYE